MSLEPDLECPWDMKTRKRYARIHGDYYKRSYTKAEICRRYKLSRSQVERIIRQYEAWRQGEDQLTKRRLAYIDRNKKIWREWRSGKPVRAIARRYKIPETSVYQIALDHELGTS